MNRAILYLGNPLVVATVFFLSSCGAGVLWT
jgi:hypothetical protein